MLSQAICDWASVVIIADQKSVLRFVWSVITVALLRELINIRSTQEVDSIAQPYFLLLASVRYGGSVYQTDNPSFLPLQS